MTFWRLMMWYGHVCRPHFLLPSLPEHILQYVLPKVKVINAKDIDDYQVLWIDCDVKSANTKNCTIWFVKKPCRQALTDWYCPFLSKKMDSNADLLQDGYHKQYKKPLKLVFAIFIYCTEKSTSKLWKILLTLTNKLLSFSKYSHFCKKNLLKINCKVYNVNVILGLKCFFKNTYCLTSWEFNV